MTSVHLIHALAAVAVLGLLPVTAPAAHAQAPRSPLSIVSGTVTLAGTSNVHDYAASTTQLRLTKATVDASASTWDEVQTATGLTAFDLAVPAATLHCPRDGVDKNMHRALKVESHADIAFSLKRLEGTPGALRAIGTLRIAGVERDITLPLTTAVNGEHLAVTGAVEIQMPDYGIKPPTAMLGVVRASPKVNVTFDLVLARHST